VIKSLKFVFFILILQGCVSPHKTYTKIPPGMWRGVLFLDNEAPIATNKKEIVMGTDGKGELPFNFEVVYDNEIDFHIVIHNAEERLKLDKVIFGRDRATAKDTLILDFPAYDTYINALFEEGIIEGHWTVNYRPNYKIKFKAYQGKTNRFRQSSKLAPLDFSGKYSVTFSPGSEASYPAVADFQQKGDILTGTFLTETGDYRYLEGKVVGNKAFLSAFDGSHAFLFELKKLENSSIIGEFRSGTHHREPFEGTKNNDAILKNGFDLVKTVSDKPLLFNLPDASGKLFSTENADYNGKVKIYEIMGTWCPNCMDATNFLKEIHAKDPDVKITALAFERYKDNANAQAVLQKYVTKTSLPYPILLAGYYDKKEAAAVIPQLEKIMAYPTLLLVDKNNKIRKVYTGFYGPATAEHQSFKSSFLNAIDELKK
jgi:thiol-disulfide isomerase/thioredoxin